jgi:hypothetical protein
MVRDRISVKTKERHKRRIQDVVKSLSRKVVVYRQPTKAECYNCYYDKMTDRSTGKCKWTPVQALAKQAEWEALGYSTTRYKYFLKGRCPICYGKGYIETHRRVNVDCMVIWNPTNRSYGNESLYTPAGSEGSTDVRLKTDPKHFDLFKASSKMIIDGVECKLAKAPALRGLGVQAVLIVDAFTADKPSASSGEVVKDYR